MAIELDHIILPVNDKAESIDFYVGVLGLKHVGEREPFSTIRVTPGFVIQMAPWGTKGGEHLAFAMTRPEFEEVFRRVKDRGIPYGNVFDGVGNMQEPRTEVDGSRGRGQSIYFFDPSKHLIEIRHYET